MYRSFISKDEFDKPNMELFKEFVKFLFDNGIYLEDKDGNFIITEKGKEFSDNDDYIHGNGRPYGTGV